MMLLDLSGVVTYPHNPKSVSGDVILNENSR